MYRFALLDPRPIPAAVEANEKIFDAGQVLGIEVTVPALAARCVLGNIDPQHTDGDASRAAIEVALDAPLPPDGATLATVRADLDSVGAMAVLAIRADRSLIPAAIGLTEWEVVERGRDFLRRVDRIAQADKFARGGWAGPQPLPSSARRWPEPEGYKVAVQMAAMSAAVSDHSRFLEQRVLAMRRWLFWAYIEPRYIAQVNEERENMIRALESGEIKVSLVLGDRVAVVDSVHRAAIMVGYSLAPVVVARNPSFKLGAGEPHTKFTVCVFEAGKFADIKSALAELALLEAGWGGSPIIGGSPQGVSSTLTTEQVVAVVARHLK